MRLRPRLWRDGVGLRLFVQIRSWLARGTLVASGTNSSLTARAEAFDPSVTRKLGRFDVVDFVE